MQSIKNITICKSGRYVDTAPVSGKMLIFVNMLSFKRQAVPLHNRPAFYYSNILNNSTITNFLRIFQAFFSFSIGETSEKLKQEKGSINSRPKN